MVLGANLLLSSDDIKSCEQLIKTSKILVANLEIPFETVLTALKIAKTNNGELNIFNKITVVKFYLVIRLF